MRNFLDLREEEIKEMLLKSTRTVEGDFDWLEQFVSAEARYYECLMINKKRLEDFYSNIKWEREGFEKLNDLAEAEVNKYFNKPIEQVSVKDNFVLSTTSMRKLSSIPAFKEMLDNNEFDNLDPQSISSYLKFRLKQVDIEDESYSERLLDNLIILGVCLDNSGNIRDIITNY